MKFSRSISALCVALSVLSEVSGLSVPTEDGLVARQRFGQGQRGQRGGQAAAAAAAAAASASAKAANNNNNKGGNNGKNNNNGAAAASQAAAASSSAAAAAASTAAANGNNGNNGNNNNNNNNNNNQDPQQSLTLDPKVIATGFANNGQDVPTAGQVASLTSKNNFINFCLTVPNLPITNGKQITTGSCNPAPIGVIPSTDNMPSAKFQSPANLDTIAADSAFTVTLNAKNIELGNFVNAQENYFAAPQQVNNQGQIIGHTHIVIEQIPSLTSTTPTNPKNFAFFKGVDTAAQNGQVQVSVSSGVPAGAYRMCTINSSSNHQPVIVAIAQHGSLDDCVYFTASNGGAAANNATANANTGNGNNAGAAANNGANTGKNAQGATAANNGANTGKNAQGATAQATSAAAATASQAAQGNNRGNNGGNNRGNRGGRQAAQAATTSAKKNRRAFMPSWARH